uniref:C2H2-type domain-containing protein n=1 Tax=Mola mola TaxID=94237 RepID=A0A3Q3WUF8_MOLML
METSKPGLASVPVHINSVSAQTEKRMDIPTPLMAVYIPTVPTLQAQPYPLPPAASEEPSTFYLAMPPLYSKETLPFLTLHIAGGLQSQAGLSLAAASHTARPKSTGKHVCPHCGRDCMKPSVLQKHLRCHTGERPYPCITCGISFKTQSNLYKHKRTQAHARLTSESYQSCPSSLDSMSSSRDTCSSSMSLDECNKESVSMEKDAALPAADITPPDSTAKAFSLKKHDSINKQKEQTVAEPKTKEVNESPKVTIDGEKLAFVASRHLPLQRQEATLFSKQWECSVARGKSQSHESTDSGFSESSDHCSSLGSVLPDQSIDCLTEFTKEYLEETTNTQTLPDADQSGQEPRGTTRKQQHKTLEERISKLISDNNAVVEDKQLENVRPRKTVLSKQGSIDIPMPYTYKDSFHFDMRISKTQNVGLQRNRNSCFYSSVPTQPSTTMEHAKVTRSNSLPFSVTLLQPQMSSPTSSSQSDYLTRRGSSDQINSTGFTMKPVNQQSSTHRLLVRQKAIDCNHTTDGLYMNSSVEEASTSSFSCNGDVTEIGEEPSNRKFRRKKTQKFAYNKWYMYGGGTFKKLYNAEKCGDDSVIKGRKCTMNVEHEVVHGLQKELSEVHKETIATAGSTINFKSSKAIVSHPDCSPAKFSVVSGLDFNVKTTQLQTSCRSLKSPLLRNLSLSILPVPIVGTTVGHKTESKSRADGTLINEEKHINSSSQLYGSQIPSDRKKQKTDDKMICPLEMEIHPRIKTHTPLLVTSSAQCGARQATSISYISLQNNLKHTNTLLPPCIVNAKPPTVSTSPANSTPSAAKTSFLPKYQLKLPNAAEPDSDPSLQVVEKPRANGGSNFTSALSSCHTEQILPSSLSLTGDIKKTNVLTLPQSQLLFPYTATTLCQAEISVVNENAASKLDVVQRKFPATPITPTCQQDYQAKLCITSVQTSKSVEDSAHIHLPGPTATMVANFPAPPTITTGYNQTSNQTSFSNCKPPLQYTQLPPTSDQFSLENRAYPSSSSPVVPRNIVLLDQLQPAAQNVFHVHTKDLQICMKIISDEQLALIEPQIERQAGSTCSQRPDMEAGAPELMQGKPQGSNTKSSNKQRGNELECQTDLDKITSFPTFNTERIKPPVGKAEPTLTLTEPCIAKQAIVSFESKPPKAPDSMQRSHNCSHVNMANEIQSTTADVISTVGSLTGVKPGKSQASEEEHGLFLAHAEEPFLPDRSVSQSELVSQTVSIQDSLSMTSLSPSTVNQNGTRREILRNESQHKFKSQVAKCNLLTTKANRKDSGESNPFLDAGLCQMSIAACADEFCGSVPSYSINKFKAPGRLMPQTSIYCSNEAESTMSEALISSKHMKMDCATVSSMYNCLPLHKITQSEEITSVHVEKQLGEFMSVSFYIQVDRPRDIPAAFTSIQSPSAGIDPIFFIFSIHIVYVIDKTFVYNVYVYIQYIYMYACVYTVLCKSLRSPPTFDHAYLFFSLLLKKTAWKKIDK